MGSAIIIFVETLGTIKEKKYVVATRKKKN